MDNYDEMYPKPQQDPPQDPPPRVSLDKPETPPETPPPAFVPPPPPIGEVPPPIDYQTNYPAPDANPYNYPDMPQTPPTFAPQGHWEAPASGGTPPPPPAEPVKEMNKKIYIMAAVLAIMVFLLCVYCIGADILHGALSGDGEGAMHNVTVRVMQQEKPELDPDDENVTADGEYTVRGVAELVRPSVVEVFTYSDTSRRESALVGKGSGIIITEDGYIITNAHVVSGVAFKVRLDDEEELEAELVGSDAKTDLAVLRIEGDDFPAATLGNSDETYVGETVVAIGNPAGLKNSVTKGIVSAIGRQMRANSNGFQMEYIQTDAAISPGNSGGALVNMYGQVIGVTSSKYASEVSNVYEGLGFAISINEALPVVTDLMEQGYVTGRFRIGIVFTSTSADLVQEQFMMERGFEMPKSLREALWISEISEDCDISHTELRPGDFILEIEGEKVSGYDEVIAALKGHKGGDTVTARCASVSEDGEVSEYEISFKLEEDTSGNY